jgi:hypothetical protein
LAGQIFARPMRDVQSLGDRFQTSQLHDLSALEGGKAAVGDPDGRLPTARRPGRAARSRGRLSRWWFGRTAFETPESGCAGRWQRPKGVGHARLETRNVSGCGRSLAVWKGLGDRSSKSERSGHACATSINRTGQFQTNSCE